MHFEQSPKGLVRGLEELKLEDKLKPYKLNSIVEVGQNTEKCPGDLRIFTVIQTSVKDHQLIQVGKPERKRSLWGFCFMCDLLKSSLTSEN